MTIDDARYKKEKARIGKYMTKWQGPLGLRWFKIEVAFDRSYSPDNTHTAAVTHMGAWQYHQFTITYYIPEMMDMPDDEIETTVLHELSHVLLASISCNMDGTDSDDKYRRQLMEFNTELVAKALLWARLAGTDDHKAELKAQAKSAKLKSESKVKEKSNV